MCVYIHTFRLILIYLPLLLSSAASNSLHYACYVSHIPTTVYIHPDYNVCLLIFILNFFSSLLFYYIYLFILFVCLAPFVCA